jgi:octanoyl-[GcvH]:protein N-octanoyltransferase
VAVLRLISGPDVVEPALDAAISRALMLRVAAGELGETLRISRPGPSVAFGRRDQVSTGYAAAVAAARGEGFEATERLAGGRAAAFHQDTLHLGHSVGDGDPRRHVTRRFEETAALVARAFRELGVDARVGEIEGEYCPGAHSVNAGGRTKLMGVGQRVIRDGAHVGGVVVVDGAERVRGVLEPVYAALELLWRPETTGSVVAETGRATWDAVRGAIEEELARLFELEPVELDAETLALAEALRPEHLSPVGGPASPKGREAPHSGPGGRGSGGGRRAGTP